MEQILTPELFETAQQILAALHKEVTIKSYLYKFLDMHVQEDLSLVQLLTRESGKGKTLVEIPTGMPYFFNSMNPKFITDAIRIMNNDASRIAHLASIKILEKPLETPGLIVCFTLQ